LSKACKTKNSSGAANLNEYLASVRDKPFEWGTHDCAHFTLGAVEAQTGVWHEPPKYSNARSAFACFVAQSMAEWFDERFTRCAHVPPVGSIVVVKCEDAITERAGVVVSDKAAFVSPIGLVFAKLRPETDLYWIVK
jgi:hypothetical protein